MSGKWWHCWGIAFPTIGKHMLSNRLHMVTVPLSLEVLSKCARLLHTWTVKSFSCEKERLQFHTAQRHFLHSWLQTFCNFIVLFMITNLYLGVLVTSRVVTSCPTSTVIWTLHWSTVLKTELSDTYFSTLTYNTSVRNESASKVFWAYP